MKVIFDRSAFHDHFDLLKGSPLLQLAKERKVLVHHTAMFLEVMNSEYDSIKRRIAKRVRRHSRHD
jgi:hypothetical protein